MMKLSFSLVLMLATLGLMLMGEHSEPMLDPMLERMTGLLIWATLDRVTEALPLIVVIALMLIRSEVLRGSILMSSSPSSASWSNRSSAPTIALKKVTLSDQV